VFGKHLLKSKPRRIARGFSNRFFVSLVPAAILLAGCASTKSAWNLSRESPFEPTNYSAPGPIPQSVRRVAVLPMHTAKWNHDDVQAVENAFARELNQFNLFEVIPVARQSMVAQFGLESYMSSAALPADFLQQISMKLGVDAVLFTDLTDFSPYQPISIGIRSKLVSTVDGRALWSFDTIFDAARPDVQAAVSRYHSVLSRPAYPLEDSAAIMQSPSRFAKYVAHATYETIPSRDVE
jgi:hypothetical protein